PRGTMAFRGARIITMRGDEVIEGGTIVVQDGRIVAVGPADKVAIPAGATVRDAAGKTIVPGFVDLHAHPTGPSELLEPLYWRVLALFSYGVTTLRELN